MDEEHKNFSKRVLEVLGIDRIRKLSDIQKNSLNNQFQDLFEEHNNSYETVTNNEIIGRYELVTEHIYPDEFVEMAEILKNKEQS
jgi:hypothetical protein